ncbi:multidrug resistance protein MdtE precursor [Variibacter gotjawalensis]|uniref:Multidrug resistance protein MdtE n=1 Tax=Variibacter gotjawalensis TaxID=1333996 RepID=A0A0S3PZN7_9BRAD|nr:efflux RND transporter periplasmic adaptor subunit [Variibacter gotjawalensis]NIK47240.1 RND family efflux transporter MFP subunit [Variibacter gotjawalensis]RZS49141.1 RND family efflux transporter MFP subunit [Variibacter gotjawalensis]BAT61402.1 multidrug resistance protein MdtE precursor [Variibacter gotjawalensis]
MKSRFALLLVPLALVACKKEEPPHVVRPVLSMLVEPHVPRTFGFAGVVEPRYRSTLGFRVLGRIVARDVNVGDPVTRGQRLAAIDPVALELAVRSAQADLANSLAQLANATATESRQRTLLEQNTTTQAQFELAQQSRESAEASVSRARANLAKAQEQFGYAQLTSDFDGVVTSVDAEVGQVVSPGQTVLSVARPDVREAVVDVPEGIAGGLEAGTRFDVHLQISPDVHVAGVVREVAPQADPTTRTRRVRITLENPPSSFRLGTTITANVTSKPSPEIELPASAVLDQNGATKVWVVDESAKTVSLRDVRIGRRDNGWVRIAEGVTPGMRVVTAGVNSLQPGQAVKIVEGAAR